VTVCKRFWVSGRVQGVFFRASTQDKALALGLTGRARNLRDGRVEVIVQGDPRRIDVLHEWLWEGPSSARVEDVQWEPADLEPFNGFEVD
jgi:acylphosphatase